MRYNQQIQNQMRVTQKNEVRANGKQMTNDQ